MASFAEVGPDARQRLVKISKGYQQRQAYREELAKLADGRLIEITPEEGESLRKLKVNARRAANEMKLSIGYGDTADKTLLVWSAPPREQRSGPGRPRKSAGGS